MTAVYEIDTWPWLEGLSRRYGRTVTLGDVPGEVWDDITSTNAVWLMGVWERSPAGLAIAQANEGLQREFRNALPDLSEEDVVGSPYCIRRYEVDHHLGGQEGLRKAREELKKRGQKLILDYVPNHVAPDHPAITEYPDWFINGTPDDLANNPTDWFKAGDRIIAHGRDPYFPPWPDVAQLNAFSPGLRKATVETLKNIAEQCDGVRVDMAMLMFNDIFARTWGEHAGPKPAQEFWPGVIQSLPADFLLIAEAYWDTEWTLQQQGFHLCYDKRLYDRLAHEDANAVRAHLRADRAYQDRLIRFTENHDEPRAAAALGPRNRAAAVAIATLPGATLWHDGQFEGRRVKLPVFLGRYPDEPVDEELRAFYRKLAETRINTGDWHLLDTHDVLAWTWQNGDDRHLVVINFAGSTARTRVRAPWFSDGQDRRLTDLLDGRVFDRDGAELAAEGLYVELPPWGFHVLAS
ncbi:alpha-amylase family glycosyl hydrolase [Paractinoplanes lichenicola]|uniref:Alpha-amylase n=1 Tax=Paractinoplanes lichenicola TaxID=2802976 RepID=A0ABS1VUL0_9ACTN|nr:alpha-amylase family glycosyl hydrolase [Actinoplanes lichenicola]MBL7258167.1 alpha-amylase [Actinoplanes lichenicola]